MKPLQKAALAMTIALGGTTATGCDNQKKDTSSYIVGENTGTPCYINDSCTPQQEADLCRNLDPNPDGWEVSPRVLEICGITRDRVPGDSCQSLPPNARRNCERRR